MLDSPTKKVVKQIRSLIEIGQFKSGESLPSERKLAELLNVSRQNIREAIRKLEFYGLVKTLPQSGTIIIGQGLVALEGLVFDILDFEESDFESLIEFRNLLEIKSAGLAATKRSEEDLELIKIAQKRFEQKILDEEKSEEENLKFHLQIAAISDNSVLKLIIRIITPYILSNSSWQKRSSKKSPEDIIKEHNEIVKQIELKNSKAAKNAMRIHLRGDT